MKISIKGAYGEGNFGDDLLMTVFEEYLFSITNKHLELNFIGNEMGYVRKMLKNSSYNQSNEAEWLIYGGGTQFFSFKKKVTFFSKVYNIFKLPFPLIVETIFHKFFKKEQNIVQYKRLAFIGFGLGPFYGNEYAINGARKKIECADFVGVRDEVSQKHCSEWNINAVLGADIVFSSIFQNNISGEQVQQKGKIAIIVRDWLWESEGAKYSESLLELIRINPDIDFTFILFSKSRDLIWKKLVRKKNLLIWDPEKMEISQFLSQLNQFDTFISARYHGAIIGGLLKKKVICIEVEDKLRVLCQQIPTFSLWEKPFDQKQLSNLIEHTVSRDHAEYIKKLRLRADSMLDKFRLLLTEGI